MTGSLLPGETPEIVRRLAAKLDCDSVVLIGCVRPELLTSLADQPLAGFDEPGYVRHAAAVLPQSRWGAIEDAPTSVAEMEAPLLVLSFAAFETAPDEARAAMLAVAPTALLLDVDGRAGKGASALRQAREAAMSGGVEILRSELVAGLSAESHTRSSPVLLVSDGHDRRPDALVETGLAGLRMDPAVDTWGEPARRSRVCIVSYEVVGPSRNGGIGTANTSLALTLARGGLDVTLLYTGPPSTAEERERWVSHLADRGVTYTQLEETESESVDSAFINVRRVWATYVRVRRLHEERPFDVVHGPECQGHLAFVALAKRHGITFAETEIVTGVHSPTRWCMEANRVPLNTLTGLADEHLEQTSVRSSDAVHSPSGYLLGYLRDRGWELPARSFVQQYATSDAIRELEALVGDHDDPFPAADADGIELVFFGRLETRKGLSVFCDALDRLADGGAAPAASITFMGSSVTIDGLASTAYLEQRAARWPWPIRVETDLSQPEAVAHLRDNRCVAVMPSLVDNSPNTVYETLALRIPIVVSRSGGTAELIAPEDLERCTFSGWPDGDDVPPSPADAVPVSFDDAALADVLRAALAAPPAPATPAVDPAANEAAHVAWNGALVADRPELARARTPTVSRIVVARDRDRAAVIGRRLAEAPDGEIVLAAEGPQAGDLPDHWTLLDVAGQGQAAALTSAAAAADGDVLLFCPEDVDLDGCVADLVARAAAGSNADVFLLVVRSPSPEAGGDEVTVPLGGPAVLGLSHRVQGSAGVAVRAEALRRLGGFRDGRDPLGNLLDRAALGGMHIETVPEVLGRRIRPNPTRDIGRGRDWPEAVAWHLGGEDLLARLRPFVATPDRLGDLPALYRASQQLVADVRARQAEHVRETAAHMEHTEAHVERTDAHAQRVQEHADQLQAHSHRVQEHADQLQAHARDVEERAEDTQAHLEHARAQTNDLTAEVGRLRSDLEAVYSSGSWRVTRPLRRIAQWRDPRKRAS